MQACAARAFIRIAPRSVILSDLMRDPEGPQTVKLRADGSIEMGKAMSAFPKLCAISV
jgi:hypothetical protein